MISIVQNEYILADTSNAAKFNTNIIKKVIKVTNGESALKKIEYIDKEITNEIMSRTKILLFSLFLYFSVQNIIPATVTPLIKNDIPHRTNITVVEIALRGKINNKFTLSALPPISQEIMPNNKKIAPHIHIVLGFIKHIS